MNAEIFTEWVRRQGRHVIRTESSYWYDAGPRVFQAFPFSWLIEPSEQELSKLMMKHGIVSLRYSLPLEAKEGMISYHVVLHAPYELEMLAHQARNGVRRGLKSFRVENISFQRLAEDGWVLQLDTLERQGRTDSMSQAEWRAICLAAEGLPGFEAWGALSSEGELAATLLTVLVDDTYNVPYAQCHRKFLREHVNNALFYTVSKELLGRAGVAGIFFSLHSLDAPDSVNEFKFRMGLQAKAVRQRVVFHPLLRPLVSRSSHKLLASLLKRYPGNYLLSKAEGMVRFNLQGRLSLAEQEWPECLAEAKARWFEGQGIELPQAKPLAVGQEQAVELKVES